MSYARIAFAVLTCENEARPQGASTPHGLLIHPHPRDRKEGTRAQHSATGARRQEDSPERGNGLMAVSKSTRYEVLRRDNHTCRYCGAKAPDVQLQVDHVIPTALGGSDDPSNLRAACRDCNQGKSSSSPDTAAVAQVADDAIRWADAMRAAADGWLAARLSGFEYSNIVAKVWDSGNETYRWNRAILDDDWVDSCERWRALGVPAELVADAVGVAMRRRTIHNDGVWRYVCGIVWNKLTELQDAARDHLAGPEESACTGHPTCDCESLAYHQGYSAAILRMQNRATDQQALALGRVVDAEGWAWIEERRS